MGLGGAFVALADDATAAYANPAGLGLVFDSFQIDIDIDSSDLVDTTSISGVYRF